MTSTTPAHQPPDGRPRRAPRVLMADRGDPLVGPLATALRGRVDVVDRLDTELSAPERLLVAATTFRPDRREWAERFFKSNLAVELRTRRARAALATAGDADVVFQTHALFGTADRRTVLYVDCTHRQSAEEWPAWNPLRGRSLQRWLAREHGQYHRAAHVFAFYQGTARSIVEHYGVPASRVSVVGAGVNFERLPTLRGRRSGPPTILFVGNDFERKGGPLLLEAFARLRRRVPDARLRIVGTPHPMPDRDGVERVGRVHDRAQVSALFAASDVFCLPSHFDPFPGALLEAMAHGLPCVVTPTCGVPEIVQDEVTALTVGRHPATADQLARALELLVTDPDRARAMGLAGRRRVEQRFLWPQVVDRMVPVLEQVSGRGARARSPAAAGGPEPPATPSAPAAAHPTVGPAADRPISDATTSWRRP